MYNTTIYSIPRYFGYNNLKKKRVLNFSVFPNYNYYKKPNGSPLLGPIKTPAYTFEESGTDELPGRGGCIITIKYFGTQILSSRVAYSLYACAGVLCVRCARAYRDMRLTVSLFYVKIIICLGDFLIAKKWWKQKSFLRYPKKITQLTLRQGEKTMYSADNHLYI